MRGSDCALHCESFRSMPHVSESSMSDTLHPSTAARRASSLLAPTTSQLSSLTTASWLVMAPRIREHRDRLLRESVDGFDRHSSFWKWIRFDVTEVVVCIACTEYWHSVRSEKHGTGNNMSARYAAVSQKHSKHFVTPFLVITNKGKYLLQHSFARCLACSVQLQ